MTAIAIELLSEQPAHGEAARELLERSFRLPDAWARHGGVPAELPRRFTAEIAAFPGDARPPAGDVVIATVESRPVAAGHIVAPTAPYRDYPFEMVFMARRLDRPV